MSRDSSSATRFELVPHGVLGREIHRLVETESGLVVFLDDEHVTSALCADMNDLRSRIVGSGRWTPAEPGEMGTLATGRYEIIEAARMPAGMLCLPIESQDGFVWLIREGEMSEELAGDLTKTATELGQSRHWVHWWGATA